MWPEARSHPIRMLSTLPARWVALGANPPGGASFSGVAQRGEFFVWQLGAYAPLAPVTVRASWSAFVGRRTASRLPTSAIRCVNQPNGSAAAADGLTLQTGEVLPLWFGLDVPSGARPDTYEGYIQLAELRGGAPSREERVAVRVEVEDKLVEQSGDNELWRHSRLRWLDSAVGQQEEAAKVNGDRADVWRPVEWDAATTTATASGRRAVRLSRRGLPSSLKVGATELLTAPMQLRLVLPRQAAANELRWAASDFKATAGSGGSVAWEARGSVDLETAASAGARGCAGLRVEVSGEMYTDGASQLAATLTLPEGAESGGCTLADVQLVAPLAEEQTRLINGFGYKVSERGGMPRPQRLVWRRPTIHRPSPFCTRSLCEGPGEARQAAPPTPFLSPRQGATRPDEVKWRWDDPVEHAQRGLNCRVWLGSWAAGLQINLQGMEQSQSAAASHCGNDENGMLQCEDLSNAQYNVALGSSVWNNANRGSAAITVLPVSARKRRRLRTRLSTGEPPGVASLVISSGEVTLQRAVPLKLPFRLLLTPVRGAGKELRADFSTRYFHMQRYTPVSAAVASAPKPWIILHQGNQLNPYINYPFHTVDSLREYVKEAHAAGARVKLYYTVRELSTYATELWALRALRGEVLVSSKVARGHAWLREHIRDNYT